jgi:hypothetical protein
MRMRERKRECERERDNVKEIYGRYIDREIMIE